MSASANANDLANDLAIVRTVADLRRAVADLRKAGRTIGLVPTMGALHEGHVSLVKGALDRGDVPVTSIFVNPTQFGPKEDFSAYPRDEEGDFARLREAGCRIAYAPTKDEMYPGEQLTTVTVAGITDGLCGPLRPGHFQGVATVVAKLLLMAMPDRAYFGEKDYQQLQVIKRMVRDLAMPFEIVGMPTVRERDGLAMSSRNRYLSAEERTRALGMYRQLVDGRRHGARRQEVLLRGHGRSVPGAARRRLRHRRVFHRRRCRQPEAARARHGAGPRHRRRPPRSHAPDRQPGCLSKSSLPSCWSCRRPGRPWRAVGRHGHGSPWRALPASFSGLAETRSAHLTASHQ